MAEISSNMQVVVAASMHPREYTVAGESGSECDLNIVARFAGGCMLRCAFSDLGIPFNLEQFVCFLAAKHCKTAPHRHDTVVSNNSCCVTNWAGDF